MATCVIRAQAEAAAKKRFPDLRDMHPYRSGFDGEPDPVHLAIIERDREAFVDGYITALASATAPARKQKRKAA